MRNMKFNNFLWHNKYKYKTLKKNKKNFYKFSRRIIK